MLGFALHFVGGKHNPEATSLATMAILDHYAEKIQHINLASQLRKAGVVIIEIVQLAKIPQAHTKSLTKAVVEVVKSFLERRESVNFLSAAASCCIQNVNEFLHHLVYQFAPKDVFFNNTKCELYVAVPFFNDEHIESLKKFCDLARIKFYLNMTNQ